MYSENVFLSHITCINTVSHARRDYAPTRHHVTYRTRIWPSTLLATELLSPIRAARPCWMGLIQTVSCCSC